MLGILLLLACTTVAAVKISLDSPASIPVDM